jgi:hypothetical protein
MEFGNSVYCITFGEEYSEKVKLCLFMINLLYV